MIPTPMPLGPFLVDEAGRMAFRKDAAGDGAPPGFTFLWRNRCFGGELRTGRMFCVVPMGRIPSTSTGAGRREQALQALRTLTQCIPHDWKLTLLPDHRIQLRATIAMEWPATAAALLTPVFALLMHVAPVLDVMEEAGLG